MQQPISFSRHDADDYRRVLHAIKYVKRVLPRELSLEELAKGIGISTTEWKQVIDRWVGIQPKRYLEPLVQVCARRLPKERFAELDNDRMPSVPGRHKDLSLTWETKPLGKRRPQRGKGLTINYGWFVSPFGGVLSLGAKDWLCGMKFCDEKDHEQALCNMKCRWPEAEFDKNFNAVEELTKAAFEGGEVHLLMMGTPKQIERWKTLLTIPSGQVTSYSKVASNVGKPKGRQAIGQANRNNPIPWLIPCHRVLKKDGALGKSHLSENNQRAMLAWEAFRADATD